RFLHAIAYESRCCVLVGWTRSPRRERLWMFDAPPHKFLVLREHRFDQLIEDVLGRLAKELRVRVQRLVVFPIEPRDVPDKVLPSRARFDHRHDGLLPATTWRGCLSAFRASSGAEQRRI